MPVAFRGVSNVARNMCISAYTCGIRNEKMVALWYVPQNTLKIYLDYLVLSPNFHKQPILGICNV